MKKLTDKIDRKYEGYIWDSNESHPVVLRNQTFDFSKYIDHLNPYIVEAWLYSVVDHCAWLIQHNCEYQVTKYDLKSLPEKHELIAVDFIPHKLKENNPSGASPIKRVCFQQLWIPEKDLNCAKMPVLKMQALIFTGFNQQPKLTENA